MSRRVMSFFRTAALFSSAAALLVSADAQAQVTQTASAPLAAAVTPAPEQPPPTPLSAEELGDVYMARKMFREAIASYKKAPNTAAIWNKQGIAWHNLGELGLARKSYEHAMKLDKKFAEAVNNVGTIFYAQKRYGTAIKRYKKAIQLMPGRASFWSNLGTAYYSQDKFKEMMEAYSTAISLEPNIFEHRGFTGTEVQDRNVEDRARYHFELARLYARVGKNDLALQYLRHSFEEGFKDKDKIRKTPEFAGLLEKPAFIELMATEPRVL
jgi:tetratricopeptide (TPR) repeat protein